MQPWPISEAQTLIKLTPLSNLNCSKREMNFQDRRGQCLDFAIGPFCASAPPDLRVHYGGVGRECGAGRDLGVARGLAVAVGLELGVAVGFRLPPPSRCGLASFESWPSKWLCSAATFRQLMPRERLCSTHLAPRRRTYRLTAALINRSHSSCSSVSVRRRLRRKHHRLNRSSVSPVACLLLNTTVTQNGG